MLGLSCRSEAGLEKGKYLTRCQVLMRRSGDWTKYRCRLCRGYWSDPIARSLPRPARAARLQDEWTKANDPCPYLSREGRDSESLPRPQPCEVVLGWGMLE